MQVPKRKGEEMRKLQMQTDNQVTSAKLHRMEKELKDLTENQRPEAILEVQRTQEMGDLSENAAYQEAKWRLRRINSRILSLTERINNAIVIEESIDNTIVSLGSTVVLESDSDKRRFQIVGAQETDPAHGRISHSSPLGSSLIGKIVGESVEMSGVIYKVVEIL